jgi:ABC-type lipoprotein export system ATPase subunit
MGLLDSPTSGEILIGGRDINKFRGKEQAIYRNRNIGFVFQSFHLEPTYTVYENMEIPMLIANIDKGERRKRIELRLNEVGLLERQKEIVNNLSGGEKQRVAIARALVNGAEIVLADEPCGNLDTENGAKIMRLLRGLADSGITVVLVTHNLKDAEISDRIVTIQNGKILDSKLLNDSASVNAARIAEENNNI